MDETQLIKQAKKGNERAFAVLLQNHYLYVKRYLMKISLQPSLAEDLTQETMIKAIEQIHSFEGRAAFSTWLVKIATRLFLDEKRKQSRRSRLQREYGTAQLMSEINEAEDGWPEMVEALSLLPDEQRTSVVLKHYYGYTYEEIGRMTNVSTGTVKSRVHHGIAFVRKELESNA
ncbi:RNA polymerase sigma factor SigY [Paenibacillus beijingensis]|uniref:RNA polymerase sigma factor n=1 Tax=Paenibacillus beijingensis TaxID=1126833 RepID=A0A0D5NE31_9BACL|nr:RNA polymerase sigma factor SigY [Paenibacillus beijingensis]AJY73624.1 RNA polymerase sigma factor SigY [Paenibacillus beijingensis]